ncbi:MAG: DNA-directed RNA polymerase subunit omega [Oscillospiraceae bacterium]|nr:DNA-directed RNA polymerase subunit omega [Oscillospiraceae bacterium]
MNGNSMIEPSLVDLLKKVDSRYALVVMVSKRARQLIQGDKPLINKPNLKAVSLAINEINENLVYAIDDGTTDKDYNKDLSDGSYSGYSDID